MPSETRAQSNTTRDDCDSRILGHIEQLLNLVIVYVTYHAWINEVS